MTPAAIALALKLVDLALLGVSTVAEAKTKARMLAEQLKSFQGGDPTDDDWDAMNMATDEKMATLRQRAAEARAAQ